MTRRKDKSCARARNDSERAVTARRMRIEELKLEGRVSWRWSLCDSKNTHKRLTDHIWRDTWDVTNGIAAGSLSAVFGISGL